MNNHDAIVQEPSRNEIDRCNCPTCKGRAGTSRVCFNSRKLASHTAGNALTKTVGLLLLLACFFLGGQARAGVILPEAGPTDAGQNDRVSVGYLTVFSSTQESQVGEGSYYYLHTGYRIYDSTGKVVKWVENHDTSIDEAPEKVELAPGRYTIWAQSDKDGYVNVPVVIKLARTTAVHLES
jgi:hypothetical protein